MNSPKARNASIKGSGKGGEKKPGGRRADTRCASKKLVQTEIEKKEKEKSPVKSNGPGICRPSGD